VTRT